MLHSEPRLVSETSGARSCVRSAMRTELRAWSRRRPAPLPLLLPPPRVLPLLPLLLLLGGLDGTQAQNVPIKFLLDGRCGPGTETISVRPPDPPVAVVRSRCPPCNPSRCGRVCR